MSTKTITITVFTLDDKDPSIGWIDRVVQLIEGEETAEVSSNEFYIPGDYSSFEYRIALANTPNAYAEPYDGGLYEYDGDTVAQTGLLPDETPANWMLGDLAYRSHLTASEVGAAETEHKHSYSDLQGAPQTGLLPDETPANWMLGDLAYRSTLSADEVGAAETAHKHTYSDLQGAPQTGLLPDETPANWMLGDLAYRDSLSASEVGAAETAHKHTYSDLQGAPQTGLLPDETPANWMLGDLAYRSTLSADEVGAAETAHKHTYSDLQGAPQTGLLPDETPANWMLGDLAYRSHLTASEVGAASVEHTHTGLTAEAKTGTLPQEAPANWMLGDLAYRSTLSADEVGAAETEHKHSYSDLQGAPQTGLLPDETPANWMLGDLAYRSTLSADEVGAAETAHKHTYSDLQGAPQTGLLPDETPANWMLGDLAYRSHLTASEVGAASVEHTHTGLTAEAKTGTLPQEAPANWMLGDLAYRSTLSADEVGAAETEHKHSYSDLQGAPQTGLLPDETPANWMLGDLAYRSTLSADEVGAAETEHEHGYSDLIGPATSITINGKGNLSGLVFTDSSGDGITNDGYSVGVVGSVVFTSNTIPFYLSDGTLSTTFDAKAVPFTVANGVSYVNMTVVSDYFDMRMVNLDDTGIQVISSLTPLIKFGTNNVIEQFKGRLIVPSLTVTGTLNASVAYAQKAGDVDNRGVLPDNLVSAWMLGDLAFRHSLSAEEVGAASAEHTHTGLIAEAKTGTLPQESPANWMLGGLAYRHSLSAEEVGAASASALAGKEDKIATGTTEQFLRGDKVWSNLAWGNIQETPTTLAGYGITDAAKADHTHAIQTDTTGNAATATKLKTAIKLSATGDVSWSLDSFDGSADVSATATLKEILNITYTGPYNNSATAVTPFHIDKKGRVTGLGSPVTITPAFSNITGKPDTLAGYGIKDATKLSDTEPKANAALAAAGVATEAARADHVHPLPSTTGNADIATKLQTPRTIGMTGDVVWTSTGFDGSGNVTGTATISDTNVSPGAYNVSETEITPFVLNTQGRVTFTGSPVTIKPQFKDVASKPTTLAGYGITDALTLSDQLPADITGYAAVGIGTAAARADHTHKLPADILSNAATATRLKAPMTITMVGDVAWTSGGFDGSSNVITTAVLNASGVTEGIYNNNSASITPFKVDTKGRIIKTLDPVTITPAFENVLNKPSTLKGYGITDAVTTVDALKLSSVTPADIALSASVGGATSAARADHVHKYPAELSANAATATKLQAPVTLSLTGEVIWTSGAFDGSTNISGVASLNPTGITQGTYNNSTTGITPFTVDTKGRIVWLGGDIPIKPNFSNIQNKPSTLVGYGITDAATLSDSLPKLSAATAYAGIATTASRSDHVHPFQDNVSGNAGTATKLSTARTFSMTGDVTWTSTGFDGSTDVSGVASLKPTGITQGTYNNSTTGITPFTVDTKGRIVWLGDYIPIKPDFSNIQNKPSTLNGYGITDAAKASDIVTLSGTLPLANAATASAGISSMAARADHIHPIPVGTVTNITYATVTKLASARTISMTGDVIWSASPFDGSTNVSGVASLKTTAVIQNTYNNSTTAIHPLTINTKGLVTNVGTPITIQPDFSSIKNKPTTLSGYGIAETAWLSSSAPYDLSTTASSGTSSVAARADHVHKLPATLATNASTATKLQTARTISMTGDISWSSGSFDGSTNVTNVATLGLSGVAAGVYNNSTTIYPLTVDAKGRVTSVGTATTISPAFSSISNKPTTLTGYGITDALSTSGGSVQGEVITYATSISHPTLDTTLKVLRSDTTKGAYTQFGTGTYGKDWLIGLRPNDTALKFINTSNTLVAQISQTGEFIANSFKKQGGLGTQFLKADGSIDSNVYITNQYTGTLILSGSVIGSTTNSTSTSLSVLTNTDSTSITTGAVIITGGMSVGKTLTVTNIRIDSLSVNNNILSDYSGNIKASTGLYAESMVGSLDGRFRFGSTSNATNNTLIAGKFGLWVDSFNDLKFTVGASTPLHNTLVHSGNISSQIAGKASKLETARTISMTGDVSWKILSFDGSGDVTGVSVLSDSGVVAGTYNNSTTAVNPIIVDTKGRITKAGSPVTITPAFSNITGKPTTLTGYGITDAVVNTINGKKGTVILSPQDVNFVVNGVAYDLVARQGMNLTSGFFCISGSYSQPTAIPTALGGFPLYFDSFNSRMYVYNRDRAKWQSVALT